MNLRPYQLDAKKNIYDAFRNGTSKVLLQLPTGAGKTILFSSIISDGYAANRRCLVLAHRSELINQAADKLYKGYGIESGKIKAKLEKQYHLNVQVASIQTVINRLDEVGIFDIVIIDEAHHSQKKNSYGKILDSLKSANPNLKVLGVTATPCRSNGSGFDGVFEELILGISIKELIAQGHLTPPKYYVAPVDLSDVKITAGDYNQKDLSEKYIQRVPPHSLVSNYIKVANGTKCIGFAANIEHSLDIVECYNSQGIPAVHVDGKTPTEQRDQAILDFESGKIQVLYNVGVFDEGFDLPAIESVQLARPTKSLIKFMQMVGRALRPAKGKEYALVLDHAGVVTEHGPVEFARKWSLKGVSKETEEKFVYRDKETQKVYEPKQLPLNIDMDNIELVELKFNEIQARQHKVIKNSIAKNMGFAKYKGFKPMFAWYKSIEKINGLNKEEVEEKVKIYAKIFCELSDYKPGYAVYLVKNYMEDKFPEDKQKVA
jgi:superfamily II DNA or RNA helicase